MVAYFYRLNGPINIKVFLPKKCVKYPKMLLIQGKLFILDLVSV